MATGKSRMIRPLMSSSALALCLTATANAQDVEDAYGGDVYELDPIIVQARDDYGNAADRATSVYVADAELERARMGDLKDLFAGLANVSVGGAIPVAQKIFVNGVDMLNLSVTVDGVSQNNRIFHHASANAFDPGLMKSVRVDPGVAAADAGPFALAGAVTMETVDAADILEEGETFGGNTRLSFSDNGETLQSSLTFAGRSGGFEYLGYLKRASGDDYTSGNGDLMTGTGANLWAGLLKLGYEAEDGSRFEFSAQQLQDSELRNERANFGPSGALSLYDTERSIYSFSYNANNDGAMWDPTVVIGYSESIVNKPDPYGSEGATDTFSAKVQNTFHLSDGGSIVAGVDYQEQTGFYVDPYDGPFEEVSENVGVFVQARLEPTDRFSVSGGLRYDWQDFNGVTNYLSPTDYSGSYSGLSGNLSVAFDVTDSLTLRGGYSNVFGGISIEDNYTYWDDFDYASLRAARSENFVLGVDFDSGPLVLGAEVFRTRIANVRDGGGNYDFESEGFNAYGTYDWDTGFARLTYSHSEQTRDGVAVSSYNILDSGAPIGDVFAFEVQQRIDNWNMMVGGSLDVALDYDSGANEYSDIRSLPGYSVVNVFAEYTPPSMENLTVRAEIQNLFDEDYSDRATYGVDYDGFSTLKEPGRTFMLTAKLDF